MKNILIGFLIGVCFFLLLGAIETPSILETPPEEIIRQLIGLEKTKTGMYFSYDDTKLKNEILTLFMDESYFNFENIESFSREKLTKDLSELLNNI